MTLRAMFGLTLLMLLAASSGCAMCNSKLDEAYGAFGGRWERSDMYHGRVGSAIAPAGDTAYPTIVQTAPDGTPQPAAEPMMASDGYYEYIEADE